MLKKIILSAIFLLVSMGIETKVLAQDYGLEATARRAHYGENADIYAATSTVLQFILGAVGIVFLAIMFYAGLRWMTARGNEEFTARAKDAMFNAMMGFILVVIAYGLTVFIFGKLLG